MLSADEGTNGMLATDLLDSSPASDLARGGLRFGACASFALD